MGLGEQVEFEKTGRIEPESGPVDSMVGIIAHMPSTPDLHGRTDDLFEAEPSGHLGFPCAMCIHKERDPHECQPCIHFVI